MRRRRPQAESMVEYAIGLGCVTAVCMLVIGGLGLCANDIGVQVLYNINAKNDQSKDASTSGVMGMYTFGVSGNSNAPWKPQ